MKTAVNQLIEQMQSYSYKVSKEGNLDMVAAFDYAIGIAKKYKEKEKEQIIKAHENGQAEFDSLHYRDKNVRLSNNYYNQNYNL
jgi:hypothetical protein